MEDVCVCASKLGSHSGAAQRKGKFQKREDDGRRFLSDVVWQWGRPILTKIKYLEHPVSLLPFSILTGNFQKSANGFCSLLS